MDDFYTPQKMTIKNIKTILKWTHENGIKTDIHYLDCSKSFARQRSDKTFEEAMAHISKESKGFFRIIYRRNWNAWLICSDDPTPKDYLEIGICGISIDGIEHFIFVFLDKEKLDELKEQFEIEPVN